MARPLLTSRDVAQFVARGYLEFPAIVPPDANRAAREEFQAVAEVLQSDREAALARAHGYAGTSLQQALSHLPAMRGILSTDPVLGIIESLLGPNPIYDLSYLHVRRPEDRVPLRDWHSDDLILSSKPKFSVQVFYFPEDTPSSRGGTKLLPGSHFRQVNSRDAGMAMNYAGQRQIVCPAGTLVVAHARLWHCKQPNHSNEPRYMFKVRLSPRQPQFQMWDLDDLEHPDIHRILMTTEAWHGSERPLEELNHLKLWAYLSGDDSFGLWPWRNALRDAEPSPILRGGSET